MSRAETRIPVRVTTRSSRERITVEGDSVRVWVRSAPVEGRANEQVIGMLAKRLRVPKSSVSIATGATSRDKLVAIEGLEVAEALQRLAGTAPTMDKSGVERS